MRWHCDLVSLRKQQPMNDRDFLIWLHARLTDVHGENPHMDYMHKLRAIIKATPADQLTPNAGTSNNLAALLEGMANNVI